jgi:hypothetical protein
VSGEVKVERGIYRRPGGTYSARVFVNYTGYRKSFASLEQARKWREGMESGQPMWLKGRDGRLVPSEQPALDRSARELIASSPRSNRVIDGREFTVVHLPPGGIRA